MPTPAELQGAIVGMGNPLLDISADVPVSLLDKYELRLNNAILAEEKHVPLYSELVQDFPVQYIAGGATQNSIRVAQWMLQVPNCTAYFGAVGSDSFASQMEERARADGVNVSYYKNPDVATGTCAVLLNEKERSLVANLSAANTFVESHLDLEESHAIIERGRIFYSAGFFLTVSVDSMLRVAKHCAANGKTYCLNLSAEFLVDFFQDQMSMVMPYADFVFGNESEAVAYGKKKGYGTDIKEIALKLAAQPKASGTFPRAVIFTQGAESTIVAVNNEVVEFPVDRLAPELLVDTNGAGDAFVGGFLSQLALGKPLAECVRAGHFASRVVIQQSGCTFPETCDFA